MFVPDTRHSVEMHADAASKLSDLLHKNTIFDIVLYI